MVVGTKNLGKQKRSSSTNIVGDSPIARLCIENGLKMTGQRRVIAHVLSEAEDHPDVEELYRRASALDDRISVATVYRTVRLLEAKGILERRDFGGGRARYEASENGHHYHLIDVDTGRVTEFEDDEPMRLFSQIASRLGFELLSHRIELFGRQNTLSETKSETTEKNIHEEQRPSHKSSQHKG